MGIGTNSPTHNLHIVGKDDALRLEGTGVNGAQARLNWGDGDYVYIEEDDDDYLTIYAAQRTAIMGGFVGIGVIFGRLVYFNYKKLMN